MYLYGLCKCVCVCVCMLCYDFVLLYCVPKRIWTAVNCIDVYECVCAYHHSLYVNMYTIRKHTTVKMLSHSFSDMYVCIVCWRACAHTQYALSVCVHASNDTCGNVCVCVDTVVIDLNSSFKHTTHMHIYIYVVDTWTVLYTHAVARWTELKTKWILQETRNTLIWIVKINHRMQHN